MAGWAHLGLRSLALREPELQLPALTHPGVRILQQSPYVCIVQVFFRPRHALPLSHLWRSHFLCLQRRHATTYSCRSRRARRARRSPGRWADDDAERLRLLELALDLASVVFH